MTQEQDPAMRRVITRPSIPERAPPPSPADVTHVAGEEVDTQALRRLASHIERCLIALCWVGLALLGLGAVACFYLSEIHKQTQSTAEILALRDLLRSPPSPAPTESLEGTK